MAYLKQMKYLLEEERILTKLMGELKRQLHCLEVEELNLKAAIREKNFEAFQNTQKNSVEPCDESMVNEKNPEENLELDVHNTLQMLAKGGFLLSEEEEEEEEESEEDG